MSGRAVDSVRARLQGQTFLTCGGVETYLSFVQQFPLRDFCAFEVLDDELAWEALARDFFAPTARRAAEHGLGFVTDCLTWRASPDYVGALDYPLRKVADFNTKAVARMRRFVDEWCSPEAPGVLFSAEVGPRGDGYAVTEGTPSIAGARDYHRVQLGVLAEADVDVVTALTMTTADEAIGLVQASQEFETPLLVSPTVEVDGRLPDASTLGEFIERVDHETGGAPVGYMVNCAHPSHVEPTLSSAADQGEGWLARLYGFRANASRQSHAELDESVELDRGDPSELGQLVGDLFRRFDLRIVGGCCGTDAEHTDAIARSCGR